MTITPIDGYVGPTSMFGTDLTVSFMPDWVRVATVHRTARMERPSWHALYRMALDVSALPILPRTVARVLVDWHSNKSTSVIVQASDVAARVPASRAKVQHAIARLADEGWLSRVRQPGKGSILTLLVPLEVVPHGHNQVVPHGHNGVPHGHNGVPHGHTIRGIGAEGHSQGHVAVNRERGPARAPVTVTIDPVAHDATWERLA